MSHLPGIVVRGVIDSQMVYFGRITDSLSQACTRYLQCMTNYIPSTLSGIYVFYFSVLPTLDNASILAETAGKR